MTTSVANLRDADIVVVGPYPPPFGGVSVHIQRFLSRCGLLGVTCLVLSTVPLVQAAGAPPSVVRLRPRDLLCIAWHRRGRSVVLHSSRLRGIFLAAVYSILGVDAAVYLHNERSIGRVKHSLWLRSTCRWALGRVGHLIVASDQIASAVTALIGPDIDHLRVIPAFLPPDPDELTDGAPCGQGTSGELVLGWCGLLTGARAGIYGFGFLLRVMKALTERGVQARALIGTGDDLRQADLPEDEVSVLAMFRSRIEIAPAQRPYVEQMRRLSVFLRPTRTDGDSVAVREALCVGVPVLASDVCTRPKGCHVFPLDDVEHCARLVLEVANRSDAAGGMPEFTLGARETATRLLCDKCSIVEIIEGAQGCRAATGVMRADVQRT